MQYTKIYLFLMVVLALCLPLRHLEAHDYSDGELLEMSLEELNNVEVSLVSKRNESAFQSQAAISVLNNEDIRRSGATSIPDLLRQVPGINVAQINSNKWAISSRGFNREFSNKLLVLIDGRSVYTPLFSGVFWDAQDLIFEDIERIEIIRGPGATLWGANAVNGVINIITKNSQDTNGNYLSAAYGNMERGIVEARSGFKINENTDARIYFKRSEREEFTSSNNQLGNNDDWKHYQAGFRTDFFQNFNNDFKIQGDVYSGFNKQTYFLPGAVTPNVTDPINADDTHKGGNLLGSWMYKRDANTQYKTQIYFDYISRITSGVLEQERLTFDLDFQNDIILDDRNQLIWGMGYRYFAEYLDDVPVNGQEFFFYQPNNSHNNLFNFFIQNKYEAIPNELFLTVGSKFEHNSYTGLEVQPNVRASWHPEDNQTLWLAISKAARIPTRSEVALSNIAASTAAGNVRFSASDNESFEAEKVISYEAGYRIKPNWWSLFDASLFYNNYDNLRAFDPGVSGFSIPNTLSEFVVNNSGYGETYGLEVSSKFQVLKNWSIQANYSYLDMQLHTPPDSSDRTVEVKEGQSPEHQLSLLSRYAFNENVELDNNVYFVDYLSNRNIPGYVRFDTRLGFKISENSSLTIVGQNLFDKTHPEYSAAAYSVRAEVPRSFYFKFDMKF